MKSVVLIVVLIAQLHRSVWTLPCLVHQVGAPRLVVIQVLLELVVDGSGIVLKMNGDKKKNMFGQSLETVLRPLNR